MSGFFYRQLRSDIIVTNRLQERRESLFTANIDLYVNSVPAGAHVQFKHGHIYN